MNLWRSLTTVACAILLTAGLLALSWAQQGQPAFRQPPAGLFSVTGALKGNGSGTISQAACADLSNASVYCSATQGQLPGIASNTAASTGNIGENISASVTSTSPVTLGTTGTITNITSIPLTAGDWEVFAHIGFNLTGSSVLTTFQAAISTTSAGFSSGLFGYIRQFPNAAATTGGTNVYSIGSTSMLISGSTTVYLVVAPEWSSTAPTGYGEIHARRMH